MMNVSETSAPHFCDASDRQPVTSDPIQSNPIESDAAQSKRSVYNETFITRKMRGSRVFCSPFLGFETCSAHAWHWAKAR